VAITGCTIQHNHTSPDSANIRIIGRSLPREDLQVVREGHVTITGNVLSDVAVNVHLKDCRGVVLADNTFWQGFQYNLLVEDCSNIVVGPNNFDRNPRYERGSEAGADNALLIRNAEDCTLSGLHIAGVRNKPAGLMLKDCRRMNLTGSTILDCDGPELALENVSLSRVSSCLLRDDRPDHSGRPTCQISGGRGNMIVGNLLSAELEGDVGRATGNEVVR
jgi:hypothetical protein